MFFGELEQLVTHFAEWKRVCSGAVSLFDFFDTPETGELETFLSGHDLQTINRFILGLNQLLARREMPESMTDRRRLAKALNYIEQHYAEPIRLGDIAYETGLAEAEFCRFFKKMTGITLTLYLNNFRVACAIRMMQQGNDHITEIAYACGFTSDTYFVRVFKRLKGISPGQYRKREAGARNQDRRGDE